MVTKDLHPLYTLKNRPNKICIYGDRGSGKTTLLKSYASYLETQGENPLYFDTLSSYFSEGSDTDTVFVDKLDQELPSEVLEDYFITTSLTPLEGFFNIPVFLKTQGMLLSLYPDNFDQIISALGDLHLVHGLDPDFKEFWKGFCALVFTKNPESIIKGVRYVEPLDAPKLAGWYLFLKMLCEKSKSSPLFLVKLKNFSSLFYNLDGETISRNTYNFVDGLYCVYNNLDTPTLKI